MNKLIAACATALGACHLIPTSALAVDGAHSGVVQIFAGPLASQTCVLMSDARLACTHNGSVGLFPFDIAGKDVTKVAISEEFGCALAADSRVFCWGDNSNGKLGTSASHDKPEPVQLSGADFDNAVDIAVGYNHACAIRADGTAWCWGYNGFGQLGSYKLGLGSSTNVPTQVILHDGSDTALTNLKAISAGSNHTCALFADNSGACWGDDYVGELANGKTGFSLPASEYYRYDSPQTTFVLGASGLEALIMGGGAISVGGDHTCSLISDSPKNSIGCWGGNSNGQLGTGDTADKSSAYSAFDERGKIRDAIGISSGENFTCAIVQDGTVRCWGNNGNGQIGSPLVRIGDNQVAGTPVLDQTGTKNLDKVVEIAAAENGVCARRRPDGATVDQIVCWGYDPATYTSYILPITKSIDSPVFTDNFDGN